MITTKAFKTVPNELIALAKSKNGIEAIRNKKLSLYAVQFHPGMFEDSTCGKQIINNFLELAKTDNELLTKWC